MLTRIYKILVSNSGNLKSYNILSRLLGLIYIIAIAPLFFQIEVLIGSEGLQPASKLLELAFQKEGLYAILHFPSLFWLCPSDNMLLVLVIFGSIAGLLLLLNLYPLFSSIVAWICFTSLCVIGGDFLVIIIDLFLSEVGFLLILLHLSIRYFGHIPKLVHFSFIFLNFRLWFSMGMVKFYFPGSTWTDLTFFDYFFPNQPMPTPLAYHFWNLPHWTHILAEIWLFVSQLILPFFVFGNRKMKLFAFSAIALTSVLIMLCGNYGYFNILSIILAIILIEPKSKCIQNTEGHHILIYNFRRHILIALSSLLLGMQFFYTIALLDPKPPSYQNHFNQIFLYKKFQKYPFSIITKPLSPIVYARMCNPYGVFKSIPNFRIELRFSGSYDSINWSPYIFKFVPSANAKKLKWFAPYYPRIDHLLFYETLDAGGYNFNLLNPYNTRDNVWTGRFIEKLFNNDKNIVSFFKSNPFEEAPPTFIRCEAFSLHFNKKGSAKKLWSEKLIYTPLICRKAHFQKRPLINSYIIYDSLKNKIEHDENLCNEKRHYQRPVLPN